MRPFDDMPMGEEDYSDVALLVAGAREFPSEEFSRELDALVARRFAPVSTSTASRRFGLGRLPRWAAGPAGALVVAGAVAAVVINSNGGLGGSTQPPLKRLQQASQPANSSGAGVAHGGAKRELPATLGTATTFSPGTTAGGAATGSTNSAGPAAGVPETAPNAAVDLSAAAPTIPGSKQIQSAQISLSTPNQHVEQVAGEVINVVSLEHGIVQNSHITAATTSSGGGYAYFSLSFPTGNLQDALTQLSRLHFASVSSRTDGSQNVSNQYNNDQRQLNDAQALRSSLLKQLQTAYTQSAIDSIKAQLRLAEQQIAQWKTTLNALQHRISYSNVTVQINSGGLPVYPVAKHSTGFTIGRAGHDALRVLVVSAGVALIVLAVMVPVSLVAALLMWLWVWLRQRRREQALDSA